jgi:hypothetical protein
VSDLLRPRAIRGEQQQPFRLAIEPPNGEKARNIGYQLENRGATFRVVPGGHISRGFMQHDIAVFHGAQHRHTIHGYHVDLGIRARTELRYDPAVYAHPTLEDQLLSGATRRYAAAGQNLLESFFH